MEYQSCFLEFWFTPYFKDESSPLIPLQPPPRYKMAIVTVPVISILLDVGSSNTFFNRNVINTISSKTCYCSYDNSSTNDLCNNASFNKIIEILVIQNLTEISWHTETIIGNGISS
jgi:hypothetical protein